MPSTGNKPEKPLALAWATQKDVMLSLRGVTFAANADLDQSKLMHEQGEILRSLRSLPRNWFQREIASSQSLVQ
jgi:hypothetical protein